MICSSESWRSRYVSAVNWHTWFAWFPVRLTTPPSYPTVKVWLQNVQRRAKGWSLLDGDGPPIYEYRLPRYAEFDESVWCDVCDRPIEPAYGCGGHEEGA
jgi:hypothetical protein